MPSSADCEKPRGLLVFEAGQKTVEIGGVCVGGLPGARPVVLIGTIFYHGHNIIVDENRGEFGRGRVLDNEGNPISNALAYGDWPRRKGDRPETRTAADGGFELTVPVLKATTEDEWGIPWVYAEEPGFVTRVRRQIENEIAVSEEVTWEQHSARSLPRRLTENFCFLLQPLL